MSTSQFSPAPHEPRSGGGGMSVLVIIMIILGVLFIACAGICAGCVYMAQQAATEVGSAIELMGVQIAAGAAVTNDPTVQDKLGAPVNQTSPAVRQGSGEVKPGGETFTFDVAGANGSAKVMCTATKEAGLWKLKTITVQFTDGSTIIVPPPAAATGPDVRFEIPPTPEGIATPSDL
jgi:hypothetical protein